MRICATVKGYGNTYIKYLYVNVKNFNQINRDNIEPQLLFGEKLINFNKN